MESTCDNDDLITYTISRNVPAAKAAEYELWLKDVSKTAAAVTKEYLGVTIITPESKAGDYHAIVRFSSVAGFERWQNFQDKKDCLSLLDDSIVQTSRTQASGFEYWFTARQSIPPRWKSILLTYLVIFGLLLTLQPVLTNLLTPYFPELLVNAISTGAITIVMSMVAMPLITRLLKGWLYNQTITRL